MTMGRYHNISTVMQTLGHLILSRGGRSLQIEPQRCSNLCHLVASGHTSSLDQLEMFIAEKNEWSALHIYVYCNELIHTLEVLPSDTITSATTTDEQHDFTSCLKW